jgi:hypothetical protein
MRTLFIVWYICEHLFCQTKVHVNEINISENKMLDLPMSCISDWLPHHPSNYKTIFTFGFFNLYFISISSIILDFVIKKLSYY